MHETAQPLLPDIFCPYRVFQRGGADPTTSLHIHFGTVSQREEWPAIAGLPLDVSLPPACLFITPGFWPKPVLYVRHQAGEQPQTNACNFKAMNSPDSIWTYCSQLSQFYSDGDQITARPSVYPKWTFSLESYIKASRSLRGKSWNKQQAGKG